MAVSSVPTPTFGPRGFIAPDESAILTGVQADMNAAFGGNLNPALDTPQGQLATSITAMIGNADDNFVALANGVDPAFASGRMQDAIARIYFLERNPAEPTTVQAVCMGLTGVVIPVGALAQNSSDGSIYLCTQAGVIGISGTVTLSFACAVTGPIACPATSLNVIYQAIPGWDSINNPTDGVLGNVVETRAEFEARRAASVALNAVQTNDAILANVLNVPGVLDAYVTDNPTAAPVTIKGQLIAAFSLFVSVAGGAALDIATAIWRKKPPGTPMTGTTTQVVEDTNPAYVPPYPSYSIKFQIAAALPVLFEVTLVDSPQVPANALMLVQVAIIAAFAGSDGGARARIGGTVYASRYYTPVALLGSWAQIVSIKVGDVTPTLDDLVVDINQVPTIDATDITLVLV